MKSGNAGRLRQELVGRVITDVIVHDSHGIVVGIVVDNTTQIPVRDLPYGWDGRKQVTFSSVVDDPHDLYVAVGPEEKAEGKASFQTEEL